MGRLILSIISLLGLFTVASGFSTPQLTARAARQYLFPRPQQHAFAPSISESRSTYPYNEPQSTTTAIRMTNKDDSLSEEETTEQAAAEIISEAEVPPALSNTNGDTSSTSTVSEQSRGFSWILIPTLLFKFAIVMLIKFATDIVVFPLLFLYSMARYVKRKFMGGLRRLFGKEEDISGVKVNGDSSS